MKKFLVKLVTYLAIVVSKFAAEGLVIWFIWNGLTNVLEFMPQIGYLIAVLIRLLVAFLIVGLPNPRDYLLLFEESEPRFINFTFDRNDGWEAERFDDDNNNDEDE